MKYSIWKRSLSLFLALLMSFSAFRLRADAELGDLTIPEEFEYGDYGVSGMTLELPPGDWEDYGEEEDSDPIDYEKTLTEDFTLTKEDGSYGNVSYFTMTVSVPLALDDYLEAHETKLTSKLKGQYKNELKQAAEDLKAAQKEVKQAEESLKSGEKTINSRIQKIKKHHAGNKRWKISKNTNIKKLNSQKASLRDALAKSKGKLTKAQTNAKNLKPTTKAKLPRNGAGYKVAKGGLIALSIIVGVIGLADMYNNPEVGYKSAFLETTATYFRAGSNVFGILSWYPPFAAAALFHAIGDLILSSETMKETLNKYFPDLGFLDVLAETKNLTDRQILDFFFNLFDDSDERIQDMNMRKSAHIARILTTKSVGGVLPVGIYDIARGATASANGIHAYKPNIYLYPEAETELQVRFQHPTALTVTDPLYPKAGWRVTARPDGSLSTDGKTYGFLFYEAETSDRYYQTREGFVIPAEYRAECFRSILAGYGLNPQEIADFNEFWCEKLEPGCDYAMYPQLTDRIDAAMPMTVEPAPDSILRIWFAFVKNGTPAEAAVPQTFERNGSTVVEWGGFFLN